MATNLTTWFAKDLLRDNLDDDKARRLLAALDVLLEGKTAQVAEILALAAAGTRELNPPSSTDYDVLFLFATEDCTIQLASGGTSIPIEADGFILLHTAALAYLKVTMGSTAGTVAYLIAT